MTHASKCPNCENTKGPRQYLCRPCWRVVPAVQQRRLNRKDALAGVRLLQLHRQLDDGVPLTELQISP